MTDAEILAKIQQKQIEDFYSTAKGSFLSDLEHLKGIQEQLTKDIDKSVWIVDQPFGARSSWVQGTSCT